MTNRWCYNLARLRPATETMLRRFTVLVAALVCAFLPLPAQAGDAPQWMHSLVNAPLPAHDDKTNAVLLYAEENVNVSSADKIKTTVRRAYKVLRPEGRDDYGFVFVHFRSPGEKVNGMRGWCIPAQGKDYEVKDKEAIEASLPKVEGSELVNDIRIKLLRIPAPDPGNIVGYEYEIEEQPLVLQEGWSFQEGIPVRESHYSIELPSGWEYKAAFLNYADVKSVEAGNHLWQWTVSDVRGLREEREMPPVEGLRGQMIVSLFPPGGPGNKG